MASRFELQGILRNVHWIAPRLPSTPKGQRYPIYISQLPSSPKFHSLFVPRLAVVSYAPFWDKIAAKDSQMTNMINTKRSKLTPNPKSQSISFYGQPFSSYRPFWDKCTEWPQNVFEKAKGTPCTYHNYHQVPIFFNLCCYTASHFRVTGQLWQTCRMTTNDRKQ